MRTLIQIKYCVAFEVHGFRFPLSDRQDDLFHPSIHPSTNPPIASFRKVPPCRCSSPFIPNHSSVSYRRQVVLGGDATSRQLLFHHKLPSRKLGSSTHHPCMHDLEASQHPSCRFHCNSGTHGVSCWIDLRVSDGDPGRTRHCIKF